MPSIFSAFLKATYAPRSGCRVFMCRAEVQRRVSVAYGAVKEDVEQTAQDPVPLHLRNAPTGLMKGLGYGKGYQYTHELDEKVADMQCLPDNLKDRVYYRPTEEGIEKRIKARLEDVRKARARQPRRPRGTEGSSGSRTLLLGQLSCHDA